MLDSLWKDSPHLRLGKSSQRADNNENGFSIYFSRRQQLPSPFISQLQQTLPENTPSQIPNYDTQIKIRRTLLIACLPAGQPASLQVQVLLLLTTPPTSGDLYLAFELPALLCMCHPCSGEQDKSSEMPGFKQLLEITTFPHQTESIMIHQCLCDQMWHFNNYIIHYLYDENYCFPLHEYWIDMFLNNTTV